MNQAIANLIISTFLSGAKLVADTIAKEEIKQKYAALKNFLGEKLGLKSEVEQIHTLLSEGEHPSRNRVDVLKEDLIRAIKKLENSQIKESEKKALAEDLIAKTKQLANAINEIKDPSINISEIEAVGNIDIQNIFTEKGSINIQNIKVGGKGEDSGKK